MEMGWRTNTEISSAIELRDDLYQKLLGYCVSELLAKECSGTAISLPALARVLFPDSAEAVAIRATEVLMALCTLAKRSSDGRPYFPARVHSVARAAWSLHLRPDVQHVGQTSRFACGRLLRTEEPTAMRLERARL